MRVVLSGWFSGQRVGSGEYIDRLIAEVNTTSGPDERFSLIPAPRRRDPISKLWYEQATVPQRARAAGADLLHVPYWAPPARTMMPAIVTIHDLIPLIVPEYRRDPRLRAYAALASRLTPRMAAVITDSHHAAGDIERLLGVPQERLHVVPLGVNERFSPDADVATARAAYGLPERYGLYLGGFDRRKDLPTLMAAWRMVWAEIALPLVVAGPPPRPGHPLAEDPRRTARHAGLSEDATRFVGAVDGTHLAGLYAGAAVYAFPSRYEGFGLTPLEAMACGTPVVAADATSVPEVVGDAGLLVPVGDPAAMARGVLRVLGDGALSARLREAGPVRAAAFTWARTADATRAVYRKVFESVDGSRRP